MAAATAAENVFNYGLSWYDDFIDPQECDKDAEFECLDHSKCINIQFLCDGSPNCDDGSDEASFCSMLHKWFILYLLNSLF